MYIRALAKMMAEWHTEFLVSTLAFRFFSIV